MKETDPFAKYDKLFDEQDKEHDEQVKEYRNEIQSKEEPSFEDYQSDDTRLKQKQSSQSNQAIGLIISIVVGVAILRSIFSSSTTFLNIFTIFIIIGILSSISKYFKNKR